MDLIILKDFWSNIKIHDKYLSSIELCSMNKYCEIVE